MFKQVGHGPGRAEGREVQVGGLREGKLSPGSPADKRPRQVDWTAWRGNGWGDNGAGPALYSWKETDSILSISPSPSRSLGEQCRTQVTTSASSGDLQPTLGEEPCAPSGARSVCCLPLQLAALQSLGERRDQVPGVPPVALGDLAHHQVSPHSQSAPAQRQHSTSRFVCSMVPSVVPAVVSSILDALLLNAPYGYAYHCKKYKADDCSLENSSLANWLVLAASCGLHLKASKNGTSDLSPNSRSAQVWRGTKHRPC